MFSLSLLEEEKIRTRQNATDILYRRKKENDKEELLSSFSRSLLRIRLYHLSSFPSSPSVVDRKYNTINTDLDVFSTAHNSTWFSSSCSSSSSSSSSTIHNLFYDYFFDTFLQIDIHRTENGMDNILKVFSNLALLFFQIDQ
jgi:hypothetical protein